MHEASASDALREALIDLSPVLYTADTKLLGPLQKMVCGVVDELKPTGMPPERVLLAIKEIARTEVSSRNGYPCCGYTVAPSVTAPSVRSITL